ncbi:hypothetical protein [Micromonospora sediminicola]|uniref:hypothetical protein n=1 Tax=Micromonospora sediminicola TaxID=946078 RepID=UPI0037B89884
MTHPDWPDWTADEQATARRLVDRATNALASDCYSQQPPMLAALEGVYYGYPLHPHASPAVQAAIDGASIAGMLTLDMANPSGWALTETGKQRLAELWGPDRVPPGEGGYVSCWLHGVYEACPGDLWACPLRPDCDAADGEQAWRQVLAAADHDPVLAQVLDAADQQRRAEFAGRMLLNAEQSGPVVQPTVRRRPAWLRRIALITAAAGFLAVITILAANSAA